MELMNNILVFPFSLKCPHEQQEYFKVNRYEKDNCTQRQLNFWGCIMRKKDLENLTLVGHIEGKNGTGETVSNNIRNELV